MKRACFLEETTLYTLEQIGNSQKKNQGMRVCGNVFNVFSSKLTTKALALASLVLIPSIVSAQNLYDDIYSKPVKDKSVTTSQKYNSSTDIQNNSSAEGKDQYKIESTRVGDKDVVVVRNMRGDTVYYSGDNQPVVIPDSVQANIPEGEYANRLQRFHGNGVLLLNNENDEAYSLDNVNLSVNVYGGYGSIFYGSPYWGHRYYGSSYWGTWNSPWYSSWYTNWYDPYWDWNFGLGYSGYYYSGWGYPYYGYGYWGGGYPYYGGGWYGGGSWGRAFQDNSRRLANVGQYNRYSGSRFDSATSGTRRNSVYSTSSNTASRSNSIGSRGSRQNTDFWNGFLSNRGYNVTNNNRNYSESRTRFNSGSNGVSTNSASRSNYNGSAMAPRYNGSNAGVRRSSEVVSVPSGQNNNEAVYNSRGSRNSSSSDRSSYNSRSSNDYSSSQSTTYQSRSSSSSERSSYNSRSSNDYSPSSNSSSYSSGSRSSYSGGGAGGYSSGGGGGSRSGGGGRR